MKIYLNSIQIDGTAPAVIDGTVVTPDPAQAPLYEQQVAACLDLIRKSIVGEVLIREIIGQPKGNALRIIPMPFSKQDAITIPKSLAAATPNKQQVRVPGDLPNTPQVEKAGDLRLDATGQPIIGTGEGSNVTIEYNPITWIVETLRTGHIGNFLPDDVLVHELTHGLRMLEGLILTNDMGNSDDTQRFGNTEEFYALLVANIYVSERNKQMGMSQPLRGNISAPNRFLALTGTESLSKQFYADHKSLIDRLRSEMIGFTHGGGLRGLQSSPAAFNPIREAEQAADDLRLRMYGAGA
jgi:hypothetical protein